MFLIGLEWAKCESEINKKKQTSRALRKYKVGYILCKILWSRGRGLRGEEKEGKREN